jgi:transposase
MSCRAAAARFDISESAAIKLMQRYRATGSIERGQMGGHKPLKLAAWRDWLMQRVGEKPDITTRELSDELVERGVTVSHVSVWNLLQREKQSYKKSVLASEQDRPDVARYRARWQQRQAAIDPSRLVFIDETWTKTNMAPLRAGACAVIA